LTGRAPVASLPMYDWPEVRAAHDQLWAAIVDRLSVTGIAAPAGLDRSRDFEEVWRDPELLLSQTCGWPYATALSKSVRLVATPHYAVEGCDGPNYSSAIIVRRGEGSGGLPAFAGRRFAVNGRSSLSGYVAFVAAMQDAGIAAAEASWTETGGHRASVRAVAEGAADIAAIDAVAWDLAQRFERDAASGLEVIAWTASRPGLPLVTAVSRSDAEVAALRDALTAVMSMTETALARETLRISGFSVVPADAYTGADFRALFRLVGEIRLATSAAHHGDSGTAFRSRSL
jgi:ABC-type phosphate/phosphonate transport system substrate-binding protein